MKKVERLAVLAIILYAISLVMREGGKVLAASLNWSNRDQLLLVLPTVVILHGVNVAVAVWMYRLARQRQASPWVWVLLSLAFGLLAPILFHVMSIHERTDTERTPTAE